MKYDNILKLVDSYQEVCNTTLFKLAVIRKLPNGKYRVVSHTGKNLGTYQSKNEAKKRLQQVEFFKHKDSNKAEDKPIDLTDLEELSYSTLLRALRKNAPKECVREFLKIYIKQFNKALKEKLQKPESVAMKNSLIIFNKNHKIKINSDFIKNAALNQLGDPRLVGKYLSDIIKFTLTRISPEKRPHSMNNLKNKLYNLNEYQISGKNLPASSSIGQSITFVKYVLFGHDPTYIRAVLTNIVRNL